MKPQRQELEARPPQRQNQSQREEEKDPHVIYAIDRLRGRFDRNKRFIGIFKLKKREFEKTMTVEQMKMEWDLQETEYIQTESGSSTCHYGKLSKMAYEMEFVE